MKTVMDAIKELKGGVDEAQYSSGESVIVYHNHSDTYNISTISDRSSIGDYLTLVCSLDYFNETVALLSHSPWIKGASLEEYQAADKEVLQPRSGNMKIDISSDWLISGSGGGKSSFEFKSNDKGLLNALESKEGLKVEDKTAEVDGMVYEIGRWYEFSNDEDNWEVSKLDAVEGSNFVFLTSLGWMRFCREVKLSVGTITPAPVKLIDGEAYSFDYYNGSIGMIDAVMRYRESSDYFYFDNKFFERKHCKNIARLVPEVK